MPKVCFVTGCDVWATLGQLAQQAKGPRKVASAYLGNRAGSQIGLRKGDLLVVALSEANVRNGTVSPHEVQRLMSLGVEVCIDEHLHGKVYLLGQELAVGSPNLSSHSASALNEALLWTRDPAAVKAAQRWFEQQRSTPVTPKWLEACLRMYRPPRYTATASRREAIQGRLWLVGIYHGDFPEDEDTLREDGLAEAEENVRPGYEIETVRFSGRSMFVREVKRGDLAIQAVAFGNGRRVSPHGRVLVTRRRTKNGRSPMLYVYLELPISPPWMAWTKFKREMAKLGLTLGEDVATREITGFAAMDRAKKLTSPQADPPFPPSSGAKTLPGHRGTARNLPESPGTGE